MNFEGRKRCKMEEIDGKNMRKFLSKIYIFVKARNIWCKKQYEKNFKEISAQKISIFLKKK